MEEELESDDPMELGEDAGSSEDEGAAVTLVERRAPAATPVGGGRGIETHDDTPESRKHTVGEDATHE